MNREELEKIIHLSLDRLYLNEKKILKKEYNIGERTISNKLGNYIDLFIDNKYDVDVEYNRMRTKYEHDDLGNLMGKILNWEDSGEGNSFVYPDIIIHKRDTSINIAEIEIKMSWKNRKKDFDYLKINEYMKQLGYQFGVYVELYEERENCLIEFGPFDV
ncbi:hypothetical protein C3L50_06525 [Flavobacterium alvei]|uniref:Uncharacterized protein n=1 Tax=Flavobacterium alvei TaxID=2080416 RepID=A0A2S5ACR4_9FLAO|nr:hypothetical protein [Flavobacterium alvei]POY40296.1 hypothetical protein C3L50_06525 [Flavobacterium alvei]